MGLYEIAPWEAAELLGQLPASSRIARLENPEHCAWPDAKVYLARIENEIATFLWANAKKSSRGERPEPIVPEAYREKPETKHIVGVAMSTHEIDALFNLKAE